MSKQSKWEETLTLNRRHVLRRLNSVYVVQICLFEHLGYWTLTSENIFKTCTLNEDSDQPVHQRSLIRIFIGRILDSKECKVCSCGQWRLRTDYVKEQSDLCLITKTRLFKYIENFATKTESFSDKNSDIFHISAQNIGCGYSLEPPRRAGSNEYHNLCFLRRSKKNNVYPCKISFTI